MNDSPPPPAPNILDRTFAAPGAELLPYQKDWANDSSRWKFGLMSRQVGKDFAAGFEGVRDCVEAELAGRKVTWLIAAPSERQSLESLNKWKNWAESFHLALEGEEIERADGSESLLSSASITFPNGSRVIAVPGQPDTVRGFSANILLTEFAFFERPEATWRAILPSITNSKSGGVKKVRLITTPNGLGNKAHDLWIKNYRPPGNSATESRGQTAAPPGASSLLPSPMWKCHFVDIHKAVAQGLRADIEELRAALDDPEGWSQEFECQFLDVQSVLLPYELIATCESAEATVTAPLDFWQAAAGSPLAMGIDFGRRRDLTVAWTLARVGDVWQTIEVLVLDQTPTDQQVEILRPRIRRCGRVCVDYTGPGVGFGDYLVKEFHEFNPAQHTFGKIEPCTFSQNLKVDIFSKLRMAFEHRELRVPVNRDIREDLHSLSRVSNPNGQITYRASHTADGHADRATALALALRATGGGVGQSAAESIPRPPNPRDLAMASGNRSRWTL